MSERKEKLEAIFLAAVELGSPGQQEVYLNRACAGEPELRREVEDLLKAAIAAEAVFEGRETVRAAESPPWITPVPEQVGSLLGRYKLLERVGEGGCGVVYVAEQTEPVRRRVALKVIKLGMDTKQVVARFEAERQALAMMDHPNIAKVLDGGATETGRPYFVMELVRGVKITDYCDRNQLPMRERLELFIQVCQAVQHAHQKGIIHRDLKPSNILVTVNDGAAVPKVIDFGIAKATEGKLTDLTVYTDLRQFIGTPAYMSPEQATMTSLDVDTRSDIYSLGVLLYELLTGHTPFDTKELMALGADELRRTIREKEPARPSTRLSTMLEGELTTTAKQRASEPPGLIHLVRGDLDWIVMKCLEKDRARRYDTANGLAADLRRHLDNEPVAARPPSAAYRLQKAWRRNKVVFTAVVVVVVALVVGIGVSTWQAVVASRAKTKALAAQMDAERVQGNEKTIRLEAEHRLYVANMNVAQQAWEEDNVGRLQQLLEETQDSPYRGFEWYYWQPKTHMAWKTLRGHLDELTSVAFSPDGQRIVTASEDGTAKVWNAASGREMLTLKGHSSGIGSAAFSPDGRRIVTGSFDATAKVWDAASGKKLLTLCGHTDFIRSVAFSPDGQRIVTGSGDKTAKVWDAASGREVLTLNGHGNVIWSVAFSPDGQRIVTGSWDKTARVWDAASGRNLLTLKGHSGIVYSVAFSPDGQRIVTSSDDSTAKVWDAASGTNLLTLRGHNSQIRSVAFSPDGQWIVTGSEDNMAKVWDVASDKEPLTLKGHSRGVVSVAFSPDGRWIITGSEDTTAKLWETASARLPVLKGHSDSVRSVAFSPNGQRIVTGGSDMTAKVWETASGKELLTLKGHTNSIFSVAFSPDGQKTVTGSGDKTAKVWDAASGRELLTLKGHNGPVYSVAFSPDGQRILTGSWDKTAKVWDATTGGEVSTFTGHNYLIMSAAFSPDGLRIVTGSADKTARVWQVAGARELFSLQGHTDAIMSVAFSPDGRRIVIGSWDQTAKVWDAASGKELVTLRGHSAGIRSVAFSPKGDRIVTGGEDAKAKVWEAASGRELLTLKGHIRSVYSAAFSPDGQRIVTGSGDRTARVWEAATAQQVATWRREEEADAERLAPARRAVQTAQAANALKEQGKWAEAEPLYRECLELCRKVSPALSATRQWLADGLAETLRHRRKLAEMEAFCRETLDAARQANDEPNLPHALAHLGDALQDQGKWAEAEPLYREGLELCRKVSPPLPETRQWLAGALALTVEHQGKLGEAESLYREAITNSAQAWPSDRARWQWQVDRLASLEQRAPHGLKPAAVQP
jgi:WD40 repeat protein